MNYPDPLDRVFPLSQGTPDRALLRPPRIFSSQTIATPAVMGHGAFLRAWAGRRHALIAAAQKSAATELAAVSLG